MQSRHFTQHELETEIAKCLAYGDETPIAKSTGVSVGMISQYLNPNDDRESVLFKAAAVLAGWIDANCIDGRKAQGVFNSFVSRALPTDESLCVDDERRLSHKERSDFHIAESEGKPLSDRIKELEESIEQDKVLLDAMRGSF